MICGCRGDVHLSGQFIRRKDRLLSQAGESLDSVCTASADQLRNSPKVFGGFFSTFFWILSPMRLLQSIKHCWTCWEALAVMQMLLCTQLISAADKPR